MKYYAKSIDDYTREYSSYGSKIKGPIRDRTTSESETDSLDVFVDVVKNWVDPTSYELTDENIASEYPGFTPEGRATVKNYYSFRNNVWKNIEEWINENKDTDEVAYFSVDYPYDSNWFSIDGKDTEYHEDQHESSLYLEIRP